MSAKRIQRINPEARNYLPDIEVNKEESDRFHSCSFHSCRPVRDRWWLYGVALAQGRQGWTMGALGGFILFLYGIVPTFQPSYFHRIYAAYGGIFIVMAVFWGWVFEGIAPDMFDIVGTTIALVGVAIIFYMPRSGEKAIWSK